MTIEARAWLPDDTPAPPALDRAMAGVVAEWSQHWIGGSPVIVGALSHVGASRDRTWSTPGNGLYLGLPDDAPRDIGARVLDLDGDDVVAHDTALAEEVGEESLVDLRLRLGAFAGATSGHGWRPAITAPGGAGWRFATTAEASLAIALSPAMFTTLARRIIPHDVAPALGHGAGALAATIVTITAGLGDCRIALADLRSMAAGDVLVLDGAIDEPVPIAIDGRALARGRCVVATSEAGASIEIVEPLI